jgi:hypothetical protein
LIGTVMVGGARAFSGATGSLPACTLIPMDGSPPSPEEITRILHDWQSGSREALDRLIPLVYSELHTLASRQLAREWRHNRLQTTAVVNEAYLKLFGVRSTGRTAAISSPLRRR